MKLKCTWVPGALVKQRKSVAEGTKSTETDILWNAHIRSTEWLITTDEYSDRSITYRRA